MSYYLYYLFVCLHIYIYIYIYYWFIVSFPIGLDFLFITFFLHFFMSWTSPLSISISTDSTLSNHVLLGIRLQHYTPYISSPSPHHMSIPSQPTISNDSGVRYLQLTSQFFTCPVFHGNTTHPSNHPTSSRKGLVVVCDDQVRRQVSQGSRC